MNNLFNSLFIFLFGLGLLVCSQADKKIIGGIPATRGQFPHQVSIQRNYGRMHFCGGSLIKPNYVLTAAHCMDSRVASELLIQAGSIFVQDSNAETRGVKKIIMHEKYDSELIDFDVAVIHLKKPFNETDYIKVIKLAAIRVPDQSRSIVSGWGVTEYGEAETLLFTHVQTVPQNDCKNVYPKLTENMLCGGDSDGGHDSCQGDSGGPLIYKDLQIGIVSYGVGCGRPGYPGVYADVPKLLPWINENTNTSARIYYDKIIVLVAFIMTMYFSIFR